MVGTFRELTSLQQATSGEYLVFDRLTHSVYSVDIATTAVKKIVQIGPEEGRIIGPSAFALASNQTFVVADSPNMRERVQIFSLSGTRLGGFVLPGRVVRRLTLGDTVLNGSASLQYTGKSLLMNQPESGALFTEYTLAGWPVRSF